MLGGFGAAVVEPQTAAAPATVAASSVPSSASSDVVITSHENIPIVPCKPTYAEVGGRPKTIGVLLPRKDFRGKTYAFATIDKTEGELDVQGLYKLLKTKLDGVKNGFCVALQGGCSAEVLINKAKFKALNVSLDGYCTKT